MTVPVQDDPQTAAVGNGVTTAFDFDFLCLLSQDLSVTIDGELIDPSQYVVDGLGLPQGGTVTFTDPPADGAAILMALAVVAERSTNYQDNGDLFAETVNFDMDRLWLAMQQANLRFRQSLIFPPETPVAHGVLPIAAQRANKAVVFDEDGNVTVSEDDYVDQAANAAASAAAAALAEQGAQTAAAAAFDGAELAEAWATKTDGPVAGGEYSAKHYAQQAQTNAGLPVYPSVPVADIGPIYAVGVGPMEWDNDTGSYVRMSAAADLVNHVVKHCAAANIPEFDEGPLVVLDGDMPGLWIWNGAVYVPKTLPARSRRGGTLTPSGTSVSIGSGAWSAHDGANDIVLTAPITKALQSSGGWAAGNNENGLFSGARSTETWYHVYAIQQDATGNVDAGLSTSYPPSDLPAGWSKWRRLGSVYTTNTGNLLGYLQVGRYFLWPNVRPTVSGATVSNQQLLNMDLPPDVRVRGQFTILQAGGSSFPQLLLVSPEVTATVTTGFADYLRESGYNAYGKALVVTNTSRQIRALTSASSITNLNIGTQGWEDFLED